MKKIKINIDGASVVLDVAADATEQQIADAVSKAHSDAAAKREAKAKADAAAATGDAQAKLDAARKVELDKLPADADARADVLGTAKAVLGLGYTADTLDTNGIRLAVISSVLGDDARKDAEADAGATGYLYRQAVKQHVDKNRGVHVDATLEEIRASRAKKADGKTEAGPITKARRDAEAALSLPRHERVAAQK